MYYPLQNDVCAGVVTKKEHRKHSNRFVKIQLWNNSMCELCNVSAQLCNACILKVHELQQLHCSHLGIIFPKTIQDDYR